MDELVYFTNSQGKRVVLSSPDNKNYWELRGRSGFTAPEVDVLTQRYNTGRTVYFGKFMRPRSCSMNMVCVGDTTAKRDRAFFEMLDVLLDAEGDGEGKLYVRRSDGKMCFLNCVYASGMHIVEEYKRLHKFSVEFYAVDPWFYISNRYSISQTFTVHNNLEKTVYPVIWSQWEPSVPLDSERPYIANTTTQERITFYRGYDPEMHDNTWSYNNVFIYTDPKEKAIIADKTNYDDTTYYNVLCPEIIVGGMDGLTFSLQPGENQLSAYGSWSYDAYVEVLYKFAGV